MPNYKLYEIKAGITSREMIQALREDFPKYGKPTQTMICNPERYGVRLTDEAEAILQRAFGTHEGLAAYGRAAKPAQRKRPRRTKPHRLVVYLTDQEREEVSRLMEENGYTTVQDFIRELIVCLIRDEMLRRGLYEESRRQAEGDF